MWPFQGPYSASMLHICMLLTGSSPFEMANTETKWKGFYVNIFPTTLIQEPVTAHCIYVVVVVVVYAPFSLSSIVSFPYLVDDITVSLHPKTEHACDISR